MTGGRLEMDDFQLQALLQEARAAEAEPAWERAIACYEAALRSTAPGWDAALVADLLRWIGNCRRAQEQMDIAEELFEASLAIATACGSRTQQAQALNCLGISAFARGEVDEAQQLYEQAREIAEETGEELLAAMVSQNLAVISNIRGDAVRALERYRRALHLYREHQDAPRILRCLNNMGMSHVHLADWEAAAACYDQAAGLAAEAADLDMMATIEVNRGELWLHRGRYDVAREACDHAFEIFGRIGSRSGQAETYKLFGVLFRETAKLHQAHASLERAIELAIDCGDQLLEAEAERELALVHLAAGRNPDALRSLNRAHILFERLRAQRDLHHVAGRLDSLETTFLEVVKGWGESIESNDLYTAGHCERVADLACRLAEEVGLAGRDLTWFRMGAFLHDVGKIAVPAEVLNKPGKLDPAEWALMKQHTTAGDTIVADLNFPWDIRPMVRSHHERWDGTGYPDNTGGEAIPLVARILALADVFDALTTNRSYRGALSHEAALEIMRSERGRAFDPTLCDLFEQLVPKAGRHAGRRRVRLVS